MSKKQTHEVKFPDTLPYRQLTGILNSWTFKEHYTIEIAYGARAKSYGKPFPHVISDLRGEAKRRGLKFVFARKLKPGNVFYLHGRGATVTSIELGEDGVHNGKLYAETDLGEKIFLGWTKVVPKIYM